MNYNQALQIFILGLGSRYKKAVKRDYDFISDLIRGMASFLAKWNYREDWKGDITNKHIYKLNNCLTGEVKNA